MRREAFGILLIAIGCLSTIQANAADSGHNWSVSPYVGLFSPSLKLLNEGEFRSPYEGAASLIDQFGNNNNVTVPFIFRAPMPELNPGPMGGIELRWRFNERHSLLIGGASWEASSSSTTSGVFPIQGAFESVLAQRKGDLSFTEFYLGWRYNAYRKPKKYDFYFTLSLHDIFNVTYRENFSLLFLSGPPRSFRRSMLIDSSATGLLLLQGGGGAEWHLTDWFSLGAEAGYGFGFKPLRLGNGNLTTDFTGNDNLSLQIPIIQGPNNSMQYKIESGGQYRDLRLDFDGWKLLVKATIYF
jgi:hypothetical protein